MLTRSGIGQGAEAMKRKSHESVWDALEDSPAAAENMKLRSSLMIALKKHIDADGLNQDRAAKLVGVTQPRASDLLRGKINLFSLDTLVIMVAATGLTVEEQVVKAARCPPHQ
jgi:predicted XRE-type DNA-binding protein